MDCREAQVVLSAIADGETVGAAELEASRSHCASCAECEAFRVGLSALSAVPAPSPPDGLAQRVLAAVGEAGAADAQVAEAEIVRRALEAGRSGPTGLAGMGGEIQTPAWLTRRRLWIGTSVTAAAAVLVAGIIIVQGVLPGVDTATTALPPLSSVGAGTAAAPSFGESAKDASLAVVASPPDYVTFQEHVYKRFGALDVSSSTLTTAGTTLTALDTNTTSSLQVFRTTDPLQLVVRDSAGEYVLFELVVRPLGTKLYALVAGTPITRYGQWPTIPPSLGVPMQPDGSPVFRKWGTDSVGVEIYTRPGSQPQTGFAVAPGTAVGDAAGGNPGWTWWLPID